MWLLCLAPVTGSAAEPPIPADLRSRMLGEFTNQITELTRAIAAEPRNVSLYSRRGDCQLFLGKFAEAVADFEKMIALDSAQDAPHWRLGIAYHFTGQFEKSSQQFEKYHTHDGGDRENGIWKFLADVKLIGHQRAQRAMLPYTRFDREPFPGLYRMFAGEISSADLLSDLNHRRLDDNRRVMFFAHYYAGLQEEILGHREQALDLLYRAVANTWGQTAENGPAYMWQVCRLHYEKIARER